MTARRPLQPLSSLSANIVGAKSTYIIKVGANVDSLAVMDKQSQDEHTQGSGSVMSGLTSLENDADDFDRLMIQNARDERRLHDALRGSVQPFRKARTHPRVGLTLENLERNEAQHNGLLDGTQARFQRPSSSSGSTRSDPAVRPPAQWGRKGRPRRDWLRTITQNEEQEAGSQEDTIQRLAEEVTPRQTELGVGSAEADVPRPSVEDSPLSRKSSLQGTPASSRRRSAMFARDQDPDFTLDFNEASLIASTPYVPRNTTLDDIRQREIESLREQAVATSRLDKIRESSPEEHRRPRSSSRNAASNKMNGSATIPEQSPQDASLPEIRSRKRTNSWKTTGKSPKVAADVGEQAPKSPILVYNKSSETVGVVDPDLSANAQSSPQRPIHRREDSQDLLRRLARVSSNTPSPGRVNVSRPRTAPAEQTDSGSPKVITDASQPKISDSPMLAETLKDLSGAKVGAATPEMQQPPPDRPLSESQQSQTGPAALQLSEAVDVDATPMPVEPSQLSTKTPVVTGAWIDTPGPRTVRRLAEEPTKKLPQSHQKGSMSKQSPDEQKSSEPGEQMTVENERAQPTLPGSALEAIVEEARTNGGVHRHEDQFGDSTIDSLEELIAPNVEDSEAANYDEDTLQDLPVPTDPPRNEAERQRRKELAQLNDMNKKLRAARTSIRDATRGIRRVEHRVEHAEESGELVRVVYRNCPCATNGHNCNPWAAIWTGFNRLFYKPESRRRRGLTWLSIALIVFWVWFILENIACDKYCHKFYASRMIGFGVVWDAPRYPFVIPTLLYRNLLRPFWRPFWAFLTWMLRTAHNCLFEDDTAHASAAVTARRMATRILQQAHETMEPDISMKDDEVI